MNMRNQRWVCLFLIFCLGFHTGVIRKKHDPILDTQTDPIKLKKKLEELKDGKKGAPTPSFRFYDKSEDFQTKTAIEDDKVTTQGISSQNIPDLGDPLPENLEGLEEDWWAEDWEEAEAESEQNWQEAW